uniref:Uncharacterized protein n=1 Tax=Sphaerodactylus townsendi TaxID=933632 RepID=A0ACB8FIT3_9SAUR
MVSPRVWVNKLGSALPLLWALWDLHYEGEEAEGHERALEAALGAELIPGILTAAKLGADPRVLHFSGQAQNFSWCLLHLSLEPLPAFAVAKQRAAPSIRYHGSRAWNGSQKDSEVILVSIDDPVKSKPHA